MDKKTHKNKEAVKKPKYGIPLLFTVSMIIVGLITFGREAFAAIDIFFWMYAFIGIWICCELIRNRKANKHFAKEILLSGAFVLPMLPLAVVPFSVIQWLFAPAILFAMGNMVLGLGIMYDLQERSKYKRCTIPVTAVITGNNRETVGWKRKAYKGKAYVYFPVVSFTSAANRQHRAVSAVGLAQPMNEGEKTEILYNAGNMEEFCFSNAKKRIFVDYKALFFILVGLLLYGIVITVLIHS